MRGVCKNEKLGAMGAHSPHQRAPRAASPGTRARCGRVSSHLPAPARAMVGSWAASPGTRALPWAATPGTRAVLRAATQHPSSLALENVEKKTK